MTSVSLRNERAERLDVTRLSLQELQAVCGRLPEPPVCLQYVDLYANTIFNTLQCVQILREVKALREACTPREAAELLEPIARYAQQVAEDTHLYLWFVGD